MFTKRHYQVIAEVIKAFIVNREDKIRTVDAFVKRFKKDNKNFDKEKFMKACGLE